MSMEDPLQRRASGVLLHPSSLPGGAIGDLGEDAHRFVDWLADAGQTFWQILPLVPVDDGGSPYNGVSALAGNPLLISPEVLVAEGLLSAEEASDAPRGDAGRVDYPAVTAWKAELASTVHARHRSGAAPHLAAPFEAFVRDRSGWLADYTLFRALRERHAGVGWTEWPEPLRRRDPAALTAATEQLALDVERHAFQQFLFERQWSGLREHARGRGIRVIGDVPIFVAHDSADVWANPDLFELDARGLPTVVSGVPPDYFSETGQRWGNPLYRWDVLAGRGYDWWVERFRRTFDFVDVVRIDHFRGFESYWEIPADEETAVRGRWVAGPGEAFFREVQRQTGALPVIAEDLGIITAEVEALRDRLGLPGMRVLQFAFDGEASNPHLPENHVPRSIAYTGTHDNDTAMGWWDAMSAEERSRTARALGLEAPSHWDLIEVVGRSSAQLAVFPIQDVLGLGSEARMNTPGQSSRNWTWRLRALPDSADAIRLRTLTERSGRAAGVVNR